MTSQKTTVPLRNETDKLNALTHSLNAKLSLDATTTIHIANTVFMGEIKRLKKSDEYETSGSITEAEVKTLIEDDDSFSVTDDGVIESISTVGTVPSWVEMSSQTDTSKTDTVGFEYTRDTGSESSDDFSKLDEVTETTAKLLRENGFETFTELYEADTTELSDLPGIQSLGAERIQTQANRARDSLSEIGELAYQTEQQSQDSSSPLEKTETVESHRVADVNIAAGEPRGPEFALITEPRRNGPLPVLELPTLTREILRDIAESVDNLTQVTRNLRGLVEYDAQFEHLKSSLNQAVTDVDELVEILTPPYDSSQIMPLFYHPGADASTIQSGIEAHSDKRVADSSPRTLTRALDSEFADEMPVKARLNIAHAIADKLNNSVDEVAQLSHTEHISDLLSEVNSEVQLDHPFIESADDFPPILPRELETGQTDIEEVTKLIAKNNFAVDLIGHAGVGKDTILRWIAAKSNRPCVVINMDESMISQDLMGMHQVDENGKITFSPGVLPHSAEYGHMLIISEINAAAAEILTAFHQALERNGKVHVKEEDKIIEPSQKFRICATRNPVTQEYNGVKELNGALNRRLTSIEIPYLQPADEVTLIDSIINTDRTVIDRSGIKHLVSIADSFRDKDDLPRISTTEILQVIDLYDGSGDLIGAAKETIGAHAKERQYEPCMIAIEDELTNWTQP